MKYTAEEVRNYADACRLAHKGPVIADMLTNYADSLERAQGGVTDEVVFQAMTVFYGYGREHFNKDDDEFAEMRAALLAVWPNPPAQEAQGEASPGRCKTCGRATRAVCDGLDGNGLGCTNAPPIDLAAVREVIAHLRSFRSNTPPTWAHLDDAADKLETALQEKGNG